MSAFLDAVGIILIVCLSPVLLLRAPVWLWKLGKLLWLEWQVRKGEPHDYLDCWCSCDACTYARHKELKRNQRKKEICHYGCRRCDAALCPRPLPRAVVRFK